MLDATELNFIERFWAHVKWYLFQYSDGTVKGMIKCLAEAMGDGNCDLAMKRRFCRTTWRWVDAYCKGLTGVLAMFAVRKSKSHRCVSDVVDRAVNREAEAALLAEPGSGDGDDLFNPEEQ